jgi:hypothetical protein
MTIKEAKGTAGLGPQTAKLLTIGDMPVDLIEAWLLHVKVFEAAYPVHLDVMTEVDHTTDQVIEALNRLGMRGRWRTEKPN